MSTGTGVLFGGSSTCSNKSAVNNSVLWTPSRMPGLVGWYETDTARWPTSVVLSGSNVTQLTDLSGQGHHLTQTDAAKRPTWVSGGNSGYIHFNGDVRTENLNVATFSLVQPEHYFVTTRIITNDGSLRAILDGSSSSTSALFAYNTNIQLYAGTGLSPVMASPTGLYKVIDCVFNGASSKIAINGATQTVGNPGAGNAGGLSMGSTVTGGPYPYHGDVLNACVFNRELSGFERFQVVNYLIRKARLTGVSI